MNCKQVLQRLLATSGPRTISAEVREHLEGCERCRRWSARLQEIDTAVPRLPVPDYAAAKTALMQQFLAPPVQSEPVWAPRRLRVNWARVVVVTAAAVLAILAFAGVFNVEKSKTTASPQDALLAQVLDRQLELAKADSIEKRVEALDHLANDLDSGALQLAFVADKSDLEMLADLYDSVVAGNKGLVVRVEEVPLGAGEKNKELVANIAKRLKLVGEKADNRSRNVRPDAVAPLKRIAATAREAQAKLQRKIKDEVAQDAPRNGDAKS